MVIFTKELKQLVLMTPNSKWLQQGVGEVWKLYGQLTEEKHMVVLMLQSYPGVLT